MLRTARIKTTFSTEDLWTELQWVDHILPRGKRQKPKYTNEELAVVYHSDTTVSRKKWAREQLILRNRNLVYSIAHKYRNDIFQDLVSAGTIGLIKSIDRYDPSRGVKFSTYACHWIRQEILETYRELGGVIVEKWTIIQKRKKALEVAEQIRRETGKPASPSQIIRKLPQLKMTAAELKALLFGFRHQTIEFQNEEGERYDNPNIKHDQYAPNPEQIFTNTEMIEGLAKALHILDAREQEIVVRYFGLKGKKKQNFNQIAVAMKLSSERVRQLFHISVRKLREYYKQHYAIEASVKVTVGIFGTIRQMYDWITRKFHPEPGSWDDPRFRKDVQKLRANKGRFVPLFAPVIECHKNKDECKSVIENATKRLGWHFWRSLGYRLDKSVLRTVPLIVEATLASYDPAEVGEITETDLADITIYLLEMGILKQYNLLQ